jgi:endogenous inhibitor of DNA gyrase (YacG/DUF329 family)
MDGSPAAARSETRGKPRETIVTCPTCSGAAAWTSNPHRPFCSLTCRLVALGVWLDEGYRVSADERGDVP